MTIDIGFYDHIARWLGVDIMISNLTGIINLSCKTCGYSCGCHPPHNAGSIQDYYDSICSFWSQQHPPCNDNLYASKLINSPVGSTAGMRDFSSQSYTQDYYELELSNCRSQIATLHNQSSAHLNQIDKLNKSILSLAENIKQLTDRLDQIMKEKSESDIVNRIIAQMDEIVQ